MLIAEAVREDMNSVLVVDDHPMVLQGCRRMLEDAGGIVVLEAQNVTSGYKLYRRHHPQVVIIDIAMQSGGLDGLALIRRISRHDSQTRILVLSMYSDPVIIARALEAGATGYVVKDTSPDDFMKAFKAVQSGAPYLSPQLGLEVALVHTRQNPLAELTPRELQTLSQLAEGKSYGDIAAGFNVSYKTVVNVSSQLRHKLKARSLPDLVGVAVRLLSTGLVDPLAKAPKRK